MDCGSPTYNPDAGGFASDENYDAFVNADAAKPPTKDACNAPDLTSPAPGSTLDPNAPPTITFNAKKMCMKQPSLQGVQMAACAARKRPLWRTLLQAFVLEGVAEAHCGAFTGENYLLKLVQPGQAGPVYMAVLSVTSYTPNAAIWKSSLTGHGGQMLQLTIERAVFFQGGIMVGGGPFVQPTPYLFQVKQ
jgi:hypothetical protein